MTSELLLAFSAMSFSLFLLLFVAWRGFSIESIPLVIVTAKLPKPITVPAQGRWCLVLSAIALLFSAGAISASYFNQWTSEKERIAEPLPLDKHFISEPEWHLSCETANVNNLDVEVLETVYISVMRRTEDGKGSRGLAFRGKLNHVWKGVSERPIGAAQEQYVACLKFNPEDVFVALSEALEVQIGLKMSGSPCFIKFEYSDISIANYVNFYGNTIKRLFEFRYNSEYHFRSLREIKQDDVYKINENLTITIDHNFEVDPKKYIVDFSSELLSEITRSKLKCLKGNSPF
ncbi:hypothetical protein FMN50_00465 [Rhodobacterales bacterium]|nr:hypothetical protein FMN50_00465 [Rhodobacterales bacterium]